ncbi:MAG: butyrate kinase [Mogibacterium sp.]|nr:butyrate kinase [Mogibacterium sp.]
MKDNRFRILTINLGSTSSSVCVFDGDEVKCKIDVAHSLEDLKQYSSIDDQVSFRKRLITEALEGDGIELGSIDAIAARGIGRMGRYNAGAYRVSAELAADARNAAHKGMAAGALIAYEMSSEYNIPAYLYDVVRTDEITDIARISGVPVIERSGATHTLNTKAVGRQVAEENGCSYEDVTYIMCHLGGGISTSLHSHGRIIDVTSTDEGTFTADRSGRVPCESLLKIALSGKYSDQELKTMLRGNAGLIGYLGTNDCIEIERRIAEGDTKADLVYRAMAYQTSKDIGSLAAIACGKVDAIVLTGGIAYSDMFTGMITDYVSFIAPVIRKPGSIEMEALQRGVERVLRGKEQALEYLPGITVK